MATQERPLDCQELFQVEACRKICQEVRERYPFLFEEWGGVVVDWFEHPRGPYECEFVVRIRNGMLFRFWGDYGGWVWFLKLPFKSREGSTQWETTGTILDYINKSAPEVRQGELTPEIERQEIERIIAFYESKDFERFEEEYDSWRAWYGKELHEAIERWRTTQRSQP